MRTRTRWWTIATLLSTAALWGCGGSGGSSTASTTGGTLNNVQPITVNSGIGGQIPNSVLTSVTICVPGTSNCQTISNVVVDTGSYGLRLLASAITLPLPTVTSPSTGHVYSECGAFADGVAWGTLASADVKLAGESAASISLQVIQDNGVGPAIPAGCSGQGTPVDSQALLGANGILGVGVFIQDCGAGCTSSSAYEMYYDCTSAGACTPATIALAAQVSNPVAFFAQDNNGVILQLPAAANNGAASASGNMIFGIGTQSNNVQTGAVIAVPDSGQAAGDFTATYNGVALPYSFMDSGSSGLYFDDTSIPVCPTNTPVGDLSAFYCPGSAATLSAQSLSVTLASGSGNIVVTESVANAQFLFTQPGAASLNVFSNLGGPAGAALPQAFDLGVPFFLGKSVFTAFEQHSTPNGAGPYFAFQAYP